MVPWPPPNIRLASAVFPPTTPERLVPVEPVRTRALAPSMAPANFKTGASTVELAAIVMSVANWIRVPAVRVPPRVTVPAPTWAMVPSVADSEPERERVSALLSVMSDPAVKLEIEAVPVLVRDTVPEIWLVPATVMEVPDRFRLLM